MKRDNITIHTYSLTAVNILDNRKLDLTTITSAIKDAASRFTQRPAINWIPAHTGLPASEKPDQATKRGLQLDRTHTTVNAITFKIVTMIKNKWHGITMSRHTMTHHNKQRTTDDYTRLTAQGGS